MTLTTLFAALRDATLALIQYATVGALFCYACQLLKRLFNYCVSCRKDN